jgi:hypothetical protein
VVLKEVATYSQFGEKDVKYDGKELSKIYGTYKNRKMRKYSLFVLIRKGAVEAFRYFNDGDGLEELIVELQAHLKTLKKIQKSKS